MPNWSSSHDDVLAAGSLLAVLASLLSFFLAGVLTAVAYLAHLRRTFKVPALRRAILCIVIACNVQVILGFCVIARPFLVPSLAVARSQVWLVAFWTLGLAARLLVVACLRIYIRLHVRSWTAMLLLVGECAAFLDLTLLSRQLGLAARCWCILGIASCHILAANAPSVQSRTIDAEKSADEATADPSSGGGRYALPCALASACIILARWQVGWSFAPGWNLLWSNLTALGLVLSLIEHRRRMRRTGRRSESDSSSSQSSCTADDASSLYGSAPSVIASDFASALPAPIPGEGGPTSPTTATNSGSGATENSAAGLSAFRGSSERSDLHRPDGPSLAPSLGSMAEDHATHTSSRTVPRRLAVPPGALRWKVDTSPMTLPAKPSSDCIDEGQHLLPSSSEALSSTGESRAATSESSFYCRGESEPETQAHEQVPRSAPITEQIASSAERSDDDALAAVPRPVDDLATASEALSSGLDLPERAMSAPPASSAGSSTFSSMLNSGLDNDADLHEHLSRLAKGAAQISVVPGERSLRNSEFQAGIDAREVSFDEHGEDGSSFGLPQHGSSTDGSATAPSAMHRAERWVVRIGADDEGGSTAAKLAAIAFARARSGTPANPLVDMRVSPAQACPTSERTSA